MPVLPLVMTQQGLQPIPPADLRAQLVSIVAATNPDYTANLPGTLIEDIASTDTFAMVECDSFLVDLVNSITPYGANAFLLSQLGVIYGIDRQPITNTSVYVVFTGPPGYVINQGFVVADGTYQYVTQDAAIIGTNNVTPAVYCLATLNGAWEVPANTVVQQITSVPANIGLSVTNPVTGIPSQSGEPISVFRERCWTAGLAASTGMGRYLKTLLANVPGVLSRLIAVQTEGNQYVIICGGGDPYQVANAIWRADFYTPGLTGATIEIAGISNTNPAIITTANNHNLTTGDVEFIQGVVGIDIINFNWYPITRTGDKTFTIPFDMTQWGRYQYGGTVTPNPINTIVTITDYPDTYAIPFVIPPQETVFIQVTWITDSPNFVSPDAVAQAAVPAIVEYINSLPAGTTPINFNVLNQVFIDSISQIVVGEYIVDIVWEISINGVGVSPIYGTNVIWGDPYSYFYTDSTMVQVLKEGP